MTLKELAEKIQKLEDQLILEGYQFVRFDVKNNEPIYKKRK